MQSQSPDTAHEIRREVSGCADLRSRSVRTGATPEPVGDRPTRYAHVPMSDDVVAAGRSAVQGVVRRVRAKARRFARWTAAGGASPELSGASADHDARVAELQHRVTEISADRVAQVAELQDRLAEVSASRDAQVAARTTAGASRDALLTRVEDLGDVLRDYHALAPDARPQSSGYRGLDMAALIALHERAREVDDEEWVGLWIESLDDRTPTAARLSDFPTTDHIGWTMYPSAARAEALRNAATFVAHVKELAATHGPIDWSSARVLDVGCGWGRIYRLMIREVWPPNLHGFDVDPWLVTLSKACLPPGQFSSVHPRQTLPYADNSFDVLFANSVLSHLTEEEHLAAVREWNRILAPGGIVIATVIPDTALDVIVAANGGSGTPAWHRGVLDNIDTIRTTVAERGFGWASSGRRGSFAGYGVAFTTEGWLRAHWPETVGLTELVTYADYPQSFAVGRKPD